MSTLYEQSEVVEKVPFPDCISGKAFELKYEYPTVNVQEYVKKISELSKEADDYYEKQFELYKGTWVDETIKDAKAFKRKCELEELARIKQEFKKSIENKLEIIDKKIHYVKSIKYKYISEGNTQWLQK